jgi:hypothetical protein
MAFIARSATPTRAWRLASFAAAVLLATLARAETKVAAPSPFHFCAGALEHSSTSVSDDDGRRTLTVKLAGARCAIDFRLEGKAQFNEDFTDLVSLSRDGSLRLDVTDDGERHRLEIEPGREGLVRTWRVNGREQPYDAAARAWFAAFLIELDRRTAVGVDQRLPVLLRKGGVAAVLAETAQMPSDYARGVYYSKLADATRLSNADIVKVLDQAASMKTGDYYASEVIKNLGVRAGGDADLRAAMFRLIQAMSSDYYRAEAAQRAIADDRLSAGEVDFLIGVVQKMESSYYKTDLLKKILDAGTVDAAQRKRLATLARDIGEDFYAAEFVKALAAGGDAGPGGARALIDAAATIESDYYLSESIAAILAHTALSEADLLAIVKTVAATQSEFYRAEMLRGVLAHRAVTDAVRHAALDASGGMSSHYRDEVEKATERR